MISYFKIQSIKSLTVKLLIVSMGTVLRSNEVYFGNLNFTYVTTIYRFIGICKSWFHAHISYGAIVLVGVGNYPAGILPAGYAVAYPAMYWAMKREQKKTSST